MLKKLPISEMHLSLPSNVPSEQVDNRSFNNSGKYSFCATFTKLNKRHPEGYRGNNTLAEAYRRHNLAYTVIQMNLIQLMISWLKRLQQ